MIHVDTTSGDVLAYVGSADYNNIDIEGQNDMVRNTRQPGSSIKPFIYAALLQNFPVAIDTPIYDIPFTL
jgi:penicillin-binding protein 1C